MIYSKQAVSVLLCLDAKAVRDMHTSLQKSQESALLTLISGSHGQLGQQLGDYTVCKSAMTALNNC